MLTIEDEIEKYYFKRLEDNEFTRLNKKGVKFSTTKNDQFETKWNDVEEDDYSGISIGNENTLHPTFTPPLLNQQQVYNVYNNENIINSRTVLINEQQSYDTSILSQNFNQNGGTPFSKENTINNSSYFSTNIEQNQSINFQPQNNSSSQKQLFEQPTKITQEEQKRWDETALSFGPKKTRRLSFKNLKINDNDNINNREKIPSINTIKNPINKEIKSETKTTMVNIPDLNSNMFQDGNFESQTNSLNQPPSIPNQNIITNAIPIGQTKLTEENQAKEYAKYLVNTTKHQDEAPINAATFFGGQNENISFRNLVNQRREQLHNNNDFHELSLESDNSKNSMDFLDEDGRPKILRNIVQGRMKAPWLLQLNKQKILSFIKENRAKYSLKLLLDVTGLKRSYWDKYKNYSISHKDNESLKNIIKVYEENLKQFGYRRITFNFVENSWWNKKNHQYDNLKTNFV